MTMKFEKRKVSLRITSRALFLMLLFFSIRATAIYEMSPTGSLKSLLHSALKLSYAAFQNILYVCQKSAIACYSAGLNRD